jgi:hypothetical protein
MPRDHSKRRKGALPQAEKPTPPSPQINRPPSIAAQAVAEKIAHGGPKYLEKNFIRIMQASYKLADEPEFADLTFDVEHASEVMEKIYHKYKPQLEATDNLVARLLTKKRREIQDEMLIESIDALSTSGFRKEMFQRLNRLTQRVLATEDAKKIEIVLVLAPMLKERKIPWGLCGLLGAIHQRTLEHIQKESRESRDLLGGLAEEIERSDDPVAALKMLDDPAKAAHLAARLSAKPGLRQRLERELDKAVDELEQAILDEKIEIDLFTEDEAIRPSLLLGEFIKANAITVETANKEQIAEKFFAFSEQTLAETLTLERMNTIKVDLEKLLGQWLRARNPRAVALQAEIAWLDDDEPAQNPFLRKILHTQGRRLLGQLATQSIENESSH